MAKIPDSVPELYSLDTESAVIGGLLLKPECFDEIEPILSAQDFYVVYHRYIFEAISLFAQTNKAIDILTISEYFKEKGMLKEMGGLAYLSQLANNTPSVANVAVYAKVVKQYSKQRKFLSLGQFILSEMHQPKSREKLDELAEKIEKQYTEISLNQADKSAVDLNKLFTDVLTKMEKSTLNADPVTGTPLGIQAIDELTTGGQAGELIIIATRPAMGKIALLLTATVSILDKLTDQPVFYFSQEMPADQLLQRFMAMQVRVSLQKIRRRGLDHKPNITQRPGEPFYIIADGGNTRVQALKELFNETQDQCFWSIECLYKPWKGDTSDSVEAELDLLIGHLIENDTRADLTFIEKALGIQQAKEYYEQKLGQELSSRELSEVLEKDGYLMY